MHKKIYLMVTIDTEEDNWAYTRTSIKVNNISNLPLLQELFDSQKIKPIYLCDLPVIDDVDSLCILQNIHDKGNCYIGTHLHPWNTPPLEEDLSEANSYLNNLPEELIREKLTYLTEQIAAKFCVNPVIFRAGRWGVGEKVIKVMYDLGYKIDTSVTPFINWQEIGSWKNFNAYPYAPYYVDSKTCDLTSPVPSSKNSILEIPATIGFNRAPLHISKKFYDAMSLFPLKAIKAKGFCHRTNLLKKLWLSPEQSTSSEMIVLVQSILKSGINLLNFTFHSTSLQIGCSPYVKTNDDFDLFYIP